MSDIHELLVRLHLRLQVPPHESERGDVPGWVLITVMSAGIVAVLGEAATGQLSAMLTAALNKVT